MRQSMTAFAAAQGEGHGFGWSWELRSVNGKGLEMRLRLPDWIEGLEAALRKQLSHRLSRGSVQVSLRLQAQDGAGTASVDAAHLATVLAALDQIQRAATEQGLTLAPTSAAEILSQRGVLTHDSAQITDVAPLRTALLADFEPVLEAFCAMRATEGAALAKVVTDQLAQIDRLTTEAAESAALRPEAQQTRLRAQIAKLREAADPMDEDRLAQELALLAVKSDVTEEIDRLRAHIDAARGLLAEEGAVGRKLDFLCQEFNREANTLCAKSGDAALTRTGLALKTVIDQMREQVQNVE